jgi:dimeric dUTPase (all-alpha-NTP-PPase superfamily)
MAILDETVEVLGSRHWKWWKNSDKMNQVDWDNVQVELIDIFHFLLSTAVQQKQQDSIFMMLMTLDNEKNPFPVKDDKFFDDFWSEFLMAVWQKSLPLVIVKWIEFWYRSGGTYKSLAQNYFIKNALNHIRQEFGYGQGAYQKMWKHPNDPTKLVEDNVVAGILLKSDEDITSDSLKEMENTLRNYYLQYVAL